MGDLIISRQAAIDVLSLGKEILSRVLDDMDVIGIEREKYSYGLKLIESNIKDIEELPLAQPEIIRCGECKHRPVTNDSYDEQHSGFDIEFPDYRCPCQCDDPYYNRLPDSDWFCGNAERREE